MLSYQLVLCVVLGVVVGVAGYSLVREVNRPAETTQIPRKPR